MLELQDYVSEGSYIECILMDGDELHTNDSVFFKMMQDMKDRGYNCFQKHTKEYVYRNMFYENNEKSQIRIYKKTLNKIGNDINGWKILAFHKEKLPYHSFPSTTMLHSISYVSKATFKINNRIFVNFEKRRYTGDETTYNKIYINYNHDDNVDVHSMKKAVCSIIDSLTL